MRREEDTSEASISTSASYKNRTNSPQQQQLDHQQDSGHQAEPSLSKSPDAQCQKQANRNKFIKSQSSPSSLTTHKFGLRPTPSPPRLIIDHQTGDIVESYPENPVYLRTYQPLVAAAAAAVATSTVGGEEDYLSDQDASQRSLDSNTVATTVSDMSSLHKSAPGRSRVHAANSGGVIPPPHSGKVYFAPPDTSCSASNLFSQPQQHKSRATTTSAAAHPPSESFKRALNKLHELPSSERHDIAIVTEPDDYDYGDYKKSIENPSRRAHVAATSASQGGALLGTNAHPAAGAAIGQQQQQQPRSQAQRSTTAGGLKQQRPNLQRADGRAILFTPNQPQSPLTGGGAGGGKQLLRAQSLRLAPGGQQRSASKSRHEKDNFKERAVEEFGLYNFWFNLRVLIVLLLSCSCIYLLVSPPLHSDCSKYRPTYTYISLNCSSVNLISVGIFTLFWYCNGVTRTLYANISSSAFIITIYSILVGLNLALAIVFFLVNTCNSQKLHETHSLMAENANLGGLSGAYDISLSELGATESAAEPSSRAMRSSAGYANLRRIQQVLEGLEFMENLDRAENGPGRRLLKRQDDDNQENPPIVIDDQLGQETISSTTTSTAKEADGLDSHDQQPVVPEMSPIEAFWEYIKEEAREFKRKFHRFLITYDLKFLGALHALCAICFQYLAMKVAVVRSYYCCPQLAAAATASLYA